MDNKMIAHVEKRIERPHVFALVAVWSIIITVLACFIPPVSSMKPSVYFGLIGLLTVLIPLNVAIFFGTYTIVLEASFIFNDGEVFWVYKRPDNDRAARRLENKAGVEFVGDTTYSWFVEEEGYPDIIYEQEITFCGTDQMYIPDEDEWQNLMNMLKEYHIYKEDDDTSEDENECDDRYPADDEFL